MLCRNAPGPLPRPGASHFGDRHVTEFVVERASSPPAEPQYLKVSKRRGLWDGRCFWTASVEEAERFATRDGAHTWARKKVGEAVRVVERSP